MWQCVSAYLCGNLRPHNYVTMCVHNYVAMCLCILMWHVWVHTYVAMCVHTYVAMCVHTYVAIRVCIFRHVCIQRPAFGWSSLELQYLAIPKSDFCH